MTCVECGKELKATLVGLYHYTESGLPNVYLKDSVRIHECASGHRFVEISMVERLQDAIAYELLKKKSLLTGQEFRFLRKWLGLTAERLTAGLGYKSRQSVSRWENGKEPITAATDHAMRLFVLRLKEETINRRMFEHIQIQDYFEQIASRRGKHFKITIDRETLKNLPFPAASASPSS